MSKINPRAKGHTFERSLVKELREIFGKEDIYTSRSESKRLDDLKVDITGTTPFQIQAKALERSPSYHLILSEMPQNNNYNLIFHKKNRQGTVVVMTKEDFYEILNMLIKNKII